MDEMMTQEKMMAFVQAHLYGISGSIAIPNDDYCKPEAPLFLRDGENWHSIGACLALSDFVRAAKAQSA